MTQKPTVIVPVETWNQVANIVRHAPCSMFGDTPLMNMVQLANEVNAVAAPVPDQAPVDGG